MLVPVWSYARISTMNQVDGFGIQRQVNTINQFLQYITLDHRLPFTLDTENITQMVSEGKSAFRGKNWKPNTELGKYRKMVMDGVLPDSVLIAENLDRLTRLDPFQAVEIISGLINRGTTILEIETGMTYSRYIPESITVLTMQINRANGESKRKSVMMKKSHENRFGNVSKVRPRWFDVVEIDGIKQYRTNSTAKAIQRMYNDYVNGIGAAQIVRTYERTDNGKPWTLVTVLRALSDKRVADDARYPPIVDKELYERVQAMKISSAPKGNTHQKNMLNVFSGMSRCPLCQQAIITKRNSHGGLFTVCLGKRTDKTCEARSIAYNALERPLLNAIVGLDFSEVYGREESSVVTLRDQWIQNERDIAAFRERLNKASRHEKFAILDELEVMNREQEELTIRLKSVDAPKDIKIDFDDTKLDMDINYRIELNNRMKKLIQRMDIVRADVSKSKYTIFCTIKYWTEVLSHLVIIDVDIQRMGKGGANQLTTTLRSVSSLDTDGNLKGNPDAEALEYWENVVSKAVAKSLA
ncbi:recombinase zinc beta ribbon domain-containing protein [Citrobacter sp. Igbk 16]|uniref:recombinase zinc beta ribbon domain-containing protein n=1 Tax=Citrobacter sp. Igbk 16 TaxID=2963958 RepID=UPI0023043CFA|nr:recombinase zinc beta ribbon domain-containing protein [Citrobacter sp. Igbk 16]MDA8516628.1 recombinase family protein [Citrobacter sp. Igbk 16]